MVYYRFWSRFPRREDFSRIKRTTESQRSQSQRKTQSVESCKYRPRPIVAVSAPASLCGLCDALVRSWLRLSRARSLFMVAEIIQKGEMPERSAGTPADHEQEAQPADADRPGVEPGTGAPRMAVGIDSTPASGVAKALLKRFLTAKPAAVPWTPNSATANRFPSAITEIWPWIGTDRITSVIGAAGRDT